MFKKVSPWIRAVEGADSGGSGPQETPGQQNSSDDDSREDFDTNSSSDEVDWKAEAEHWKKHARTWEARAKENQAALAEREKQKTEQSDDTGIRERIATIEQELAAARAENLKLSIGAEFNLTKDDVDTYLHGSEEDMRRQAEGLVNRGVQSKSPENDLQGRGGSGTSKASAETWAKKLLGTE